MFVAFIFLGYLYWDHNIPEKNDIRWLKGMLEVLKGNEHAVAYNGKYNLGQKMLFWTLNLAMVTLLVTASLCGVNFSRTTSLFGITFCDFTSLFKCIHVVHGILVHMYMAFWVKGSIRGIVEGWVTVRWAKNTTRNGITKKYFLS